ncbi:MAG TPA: hypothetical protein VGP91_01170 [Actinoplanes sp.]|jgi:hypothetical protein|nr:hypothetical protein [Actinoplanes sp.]
MSESSQPGALADDMMAEPTPFDDVDVEQDVARDGEAPSGDTLTAEETAEIEKQVEEIVTSNRGRGPGEQISVDPEDVN